jgi:DNA-binding response OmpR family regulator
MAQKERMDLIILHIGLPAGDGFIVLECLPQSAQLSSIPVIVLTARDPQHNREHTLKAGVCAFLQKPADSNELMDVIRTTLNPVWLQARWRRGIRAPQVLEIKVDAAEVSASTNLMVSRAVSLP